MRLSYEDAKKVNEEVLESTRKHRVIIAFLYRHFLAMEMHDDYDFNIDEPHDKFFNNDYHEGLRCIMQLIQNETIEDEFKIMDIRDFIAHDVVEKIDSDASN